MSGLLRNLFAIACALWARARLVPSAGASTSFLVTPLDTGIATLKSDRYLQLAEAAQVDWLIRCGLMRTLVARRCAWVNVAQQVRFERPVRVFSRVRVHTQLAWADASCAYVRHGYFVGGVRHAQVLVKMKFKEGRVTVAPAAFFGGLPGAKPVDIAAWDAALAALPAA